MTIKAGVVSAEAELNSTDIAQRVWDALPLEAEANLWGQEIYFTIPVHAKLERATTKVERGDLGYWPEGPAFCIFFGPTPISRGDEIRPASAVTVFGKVTGDVSIFERVQEGDNVIVSKVPEDAKAQGKGRL